MPYSRADGAGWCNVLWFIVTAKNEFFTIHCECVNVVAYNRQLLMLTSVADSCEYVLYATDKCWRCRLV